MIAPARIAVDGGQLVSELYRCFASAWLTTVWFLVDRYEVSDVPQTVAPFGSEHVNCEHWRLRAKHIFVTFGKEFVRCSQQARKENHTHIRARARTHIIKYSQFFPT